MILCRSSTLALSGKNWKQAEKFENEKVAGELDTNGQSIGSQSSSAVQSGGGGTSKVFGPKFVAIWSWTWAEPLSALDILRLKISG